MRNLAEHRRETAIKDLGNTVVKRNVCIISLILFSVMLLCVPICQFISEIRSGEMPHVFRAYELLSEPKREAIEKYEDVLEDESVLTNWLLPSVQTILTRLLHIGNEQVYLGRDGWLFYRADIDSLISLSGDHSQIEHKIKPIHGKYQDALNSLVDFKRQLDERNITLVVMPIPVKPSIHPEKFSARYNNLDAPLHNLNYTEFVKTLMSHEIMVYDPSLLLFESSRQNEQYLKTDTHWRPGAMERVANNLATFIAERVEFTNALTTAYSKTETKVTNVGDIAKMLNLQEQQTQFQPEHAISHVIQTQSGELWQPDRNAEILFLGDSFSNIYSLAGMEWGESAGFVEHLSAALSMPIDRIVINAGGAFSTRQALVQQVERLDGKRVLVYQFATRELFSGDWKLIPMPQIQSLSAGENVKPTLLNDEITLTASIKDITNPPAPGSVPYTECIIAIHLENVKIPELPEEFVVFVWGMRKNKWTEAATFKIGQEVKFRLRPWDSVQADYENYNRKELENEEAWLLDVYWGEIP